MESFGVIENVYAVPEREREYALSLRYPFIKFDASPGRTVRDMYDPSSDSYKKITKFFEDRGEYVHITSHAYRIATDTDFYSCFVHTDPADYQVVISLTPEHALEDIEHYMVHESGVESIDYMKQKYDPEYEDSIKFARNDSRETDMTDLKKMSITASEPITYNKAVIINCRKFHAPSKGLFGKSMESGRLIEIYTMKIRSQFASPEYPFLWYHDNVLSDKDCDTLVDLIKKMAMGGGDQEIANEFNSYKGGIVNNMVSAYFDKAVETTPELEELVNLKKKKVHLDIDLTAEYYPQFYFRDWASELSNIPATFNVLIHLNDNPTGLTLFNHFNNTTKVIPTKKGSLLIYPCSWMYPVKQTRIIKGDKFVISGQIRFLPIQPQGHPSGQPQGHPSGQPHGPHHLPPPEAFSYEKPKRK